MNPAMEAYDDMRRNQNGPGDRHQQRGRVAELTRQKLEQNDDETYIGARDGVQKFDRRAEKSVAPKYKGLLPLLGLYGHFQVDLSKASDTLSMRI